MRSPSRLYLCAGSRLGGEEWARRGRRRERALDHRQGALVALDHDGPDLALRGEARAESAGGRQPRDGGQGRHTMAARARTAASRPEAELLRALTKFFFRRWGPCPSPIPRLRRFSFSPFPSLDPRLEPHEGRKDGSLEEVLRGSGLRRGCRVPPCGGFDPWLHARLHVWLTGDSRLRRAPWPGPSALWSEGQSTEEDDAWRDGDGCKSKNKDALTEIPG